MLYGIDWRTVRPRGPWVLAKSDPRAKQTRGGIFLTEEITGLERVSVESATILRVGTRIKEHIGVELHEGDRFCFRGFLKDASLYEFMKSDDGTSVFLIDARDILALVGEDTEIGVYT